MLTSNYIIPDRNYSRFSSAYIDENASSMWLHEKCYEIVQTIFFETSDQFIEKIQDVTQKIKRFYAAPHSAFHPTLKHLKFDHLTIGFPSDYKEFPKIHLIHALIHIIISSKYSLNMKGRAQYALQKLESIDPGIEPINCEISRYLDQKSQHAFQKLKNYTKICLSPLQVKLPIRPYLIHKASHAKQIPYIPPKLQNKAVHDAFWKLEKILIAGQGTFYSNLLEIGDNENIAIVQEKQMIAKWLRDVTLVLEDGTVIIPQRLHHDRNFVGMVNLLNRSREELMGWVGENKISDQLIDALIPGSLEAPFYFEGGNLLPTMSKEGKKIFLCGANNILYTLVNAAQSFENPIDLILELKRLEEKTSPLLEKEKIQKVQQILKDSGLLLNIPKSSDQEFLAKIFIAAIHYIQKKMHETLKAEVLVLGEVFEPLVEFHLDMFLAPAPYGIVFLQNHNLCISLLKKIASENTLTSEEEQQMELYIKLAEEKQKKQGKRLHDISLQLQAAGFEVVDVPAVFFEGDDKIAVNFINGIFGFSENGLICISNGSLHSFDRYLRNAFANFLQSYDYRHVYFVGRKSSGPISSQGKLEYIEADEGLKDFGGIHCRTQERNALFKPQQLFFTKTQKDQFLSQSVMVTFPLFLKKMLLIKNTFD